MSMNAKTLDARAHRVEQVNFLLKSISGCGRGFFKREGVQAYFLLLLPAQAVFVDEWTGKQIRPRQTARRWVGFTGGGTMRDLVLALYGYIMRGTPIPAYSLGPWPEHCCDGDLWGYGKDNMGALRILAQASGILSRPLCRKVKA